LVEFCYGRKFGNFLKGIGFLPQKNDRINFVVVTPKGDQDAGADHFQNPVSLGWTQKYPAIYGGSSGSFSGF